MEPLYTCPQCTVRHDTLGLCLVCRPIPPRPAPVLPSGGRFDRDAFNRATPEQQRAAQEAAGPAAAAWGARFEAQGRKAKKGGR